MADQLRSSVSGILPRFFRDSSGLLIHSFIHFLFKFCRASCRAFIIIIIIILHFFLVSFLFGLVCLADVSFMRFQLRIIFDDSMAFPCGSPAFSLDSPAVEGEPRREPPGAARLLQSAEHPTTQKNVNETIKNKQNKLTQITSERKKERKKEMRKCFRGETMDEGH